MYLHDLIVKQTDKPAKTSLGPKLICT